MDGLLPVIKMIKNEINNLNELYSNMSETVSNLEKTVSDLNKTVVNLEECVEEHKSQTSSELADLRALLQSDIDGHPTTDVVANSVLLRVLPYLNNMEDDVFDKIDESAISLAADFHDDLSSLKDSVTDIKVKVCDLNETVGDLEETVEEHKSQTSSELVDLRALLQSHIDGHPTTDVVGNTVLLKLLPYLSNMEDELNDRIDESANSLAADLTDIKVKVCDLNETVGDLEETVEEHKIQTSSELADLGTLLQFHIDNPPTTGDGVLITLLPYLDDIKEDLGEKIDVSASSLVGHVNDGHSSLSGGVNYLEDKVCNISEELESIHDLLQEHVEYAPPPKECGGPGWRRVVYLDMADPTTSCPSGWQHETDCPERSCGQINSSSLTCDSAFFPVPEGPYTKVCGTVVGYQYGDTDAFEAYNDGEVTTIDEAYVSGASLTHGSPGSREHIWTFAAGATENTYRLTYDSQKGNCPCDTYIHIGIPSFVGECYFCESGDNTNVYAERFFPNDPLWDAQGCICQSTCCSMNDPPYFTKELPNPTTDDIEARICRYGNGDVVIGFIELYVM